MSRVADSIRVRWQFDRTFFKSCTTAEQANERTDEQARALVSKSPSREESNGAHTPPARRSDGTWIGFFSLGFEQFNDSATFRSTLRRLTLRAREENETSTVRRRRKAIRLVGIGGNWQPARFSAAARRLRAPGIVVALSTNCWWHTCRFERRIDFLLLTVPCAATVPLFRSVGVSAAFRPVLARKGTPSRRTTTCYWGVS